MNATLGSPNLWVRLVNDAYSLGNAKLALEAVFLFGNEPPSDSDFWTHDSARGRDVYASFLDGVFGKTAPQPVASRW